MRRSSPKTPPIQMFVVIAYMLLYVIIMILQISMTASR